MIELEVVVSGCGHALERTLTREVEDHARECRQAGWLARFQGLGRGVEFTVRFQDEVESKPSASSGSAPGEQGRLDFGDGEEQP